MSVIAFIANGKPRVADGGATVADVLRDLDLPPPAVIVEYNGEPLDREKFRLTQLCDGDRIEIAQMVGGG